jgi:uncharacterized protein DUF4197
MFNLGKRLGTLLGLAALFVAPVARALDVDTVAKGLIESLKVGIDNVVKQVGVTDGFLKNDAIKIVLPDDLKPVADMASKAGGSALTDHLVETMNRAAEAAAPAAKDVFLTAIGSLTFEDATAILKGRENEATLFLQKTAGEELKKRMLPLVTEKVESVGALKAYNDLVGKAKGVPLLGATGLDVGQFDLNQYVTNKAVDGIFLVLGQEEKKIRQNPEARVTSLLKDVFGSLGN